MAYGNEVYMQSNQRTLAQVADMRDAPKVMHLEDRLCAALEQLEMAHNALDQLEDAANKPEGPPVQPHGVLMAGERVFDRAQMLRQRIQEIQQRIGRL